MHEDIAQAPGLRRQVSRWQIVALAVNDVIGSGIYLLPAAAAALLGSASVPAVLLAGLAVLLLVACFAQAGSWFDRPGGAYLYTREAFGDFIGFETGWMTWWARVASVAALANGLALALAAFWPESAAGFGRVFTVLAAMTLVTGVNLVGVGAGARMASLFTIAKLLPLFAFIALGAAHLRFVPARLPTDFSLPDLGAAALLLLFAFAGFENTAAAAGEYRNPRRDVPFAMFMMIVTVTVVYFLVQWIAVLLLPDLANAEAPLAQAAHALAGAPAAALLTLGAAVSILGNVGNTMLTGPRYLYALARDGYGPRMLAAVHPRWRTPAPAILLQAALATALALTGGFVQLALLSVVARLITYLGTAAAVLVLYPTHASRAGALRLPGGRAYAVLAIVLSLLLLLAMGRANLIAAAVALALGALVHRRRQRAKDIAN